MGKQMIKYIITKNTVKITLFTMSVYLKLMMLEIQLEKESDQKHARVLSSNRDGSQIELIHQVVCHPHRYVFSAPETMFAFFCSFH